MREHTPTQSDDLCDLVSDRAIAAKPLILTSNRPPKDWCPLFPNPVVAESLLDRLINTSYQVTHGRPVLPTPETTRNNHHLTARHSFATVTNSGARTWNYVTADRSVRARAQLRAVPVVFVQANMRAGVIGCGGG